MKALIFAAVFFLSLQASAGSSSSGDIILRDTQMPEFTSSGSAKIENCVFTHSLTVDGSADVYHTKFKQGVVNGSLTAHGIEARNLIVNGSASLAAKSDVGDLNVAGALNIKSSYINNAKIEGSVFGDEAYIKKISTNGDLHFINSDLGKVFVNHNLDDKKNITIKLFGDTTVRHLTIDSPLTIIVLDEKSKKTFNKSIVKSNGKVEYQ